MKKKPIKLKPLVLSDKLKYIDKDYFRHIFSSKKIAIYVSAFFLVMILFFFSERKDYELVVDRSVNLSTQRVGGVSSTNFILQNGDFLFDILQNIGINGDSLALLTASDKKKILNKLIIGSYIEADYLEDGTLEALIISNGTDKYTSFIRGKKRDFLGRPQSEDIFQIKEEKLSNIAYGVFYQGVIEDSFYLAGLEAGMTDAMIMNIVKIFEGSIDFIYDIQKGDEFYLLADSVYSINGDEMEPRIRKVIFKTKGRTYEAFRFEKDSGELIGFYDVNGKSFESKFLRVPVNVVRITSKFNPNRLHPIFKKVMPHNGIDYAAPLNTPIFTIADGIVSFIGVQRGYGNIVEINHSNGYITRYAHMNKFNTRLKKGMRVQQRDIIGYMGMTGAATGVHLHFEFRKNGKPINFESVNLPQKQTLDAAKKQLFFAQRDKVEQEFEARMQAYSLEKNEKK